MGAQPKTDTEKQADLPGQYTDNSDALEETKFAPEGIWLAPDFHPINITQQLQNQLLADGGAIDQALLFWEHMSASDWYAIANQREYQTGQQGVHYQFVAEDVGWVLEDVLGPDSKSL